MNDPRPPRGGSLLERAATVYDFDTAFRARGGGAPTPPPETARVAASALPPAPRPHAGGRHVAIDRARLAEQGLLMPGAPVTLMAEEYRLAKRQLLLTAQGLAASRGNRARTILVASPSPRDGKTYSAVNLALSLSAERDTRVLLIDADVAKPDVLARLGVEAAGAPGLLDALADPRIAVEDCILTTDIPQLSLLPAGARTSQDTELLASPRTGALLDALLEADPGRILIFDSPPALAASPAATLALHVGQIMLVVRADRTGARDVEDAIALLDGCEEVRLLLNAVSLAPGGRRFGSYYGMEDA